MNDDTSPEIKRRVIEHYRAMSIPERWQRVAELNRVVEAFAAADVRRRYPDATEREVRLRVASRRVPADLMRRALGWDPNKEGR